MLPFLKHRSWDRENRKAVFRILPMIFQHIWKLFFKKPLNSVALFGQFGSQGALPLCYLSDSTSGSLKYTRFLVPVQYYFILLQTTMNSAGSRGTQVERRCSQMMSGSQWPRRRVLWCSAGCCAGSVERDPFGGFNWKHNPGNKLALHFNIYTFSE